MVYLILSVFQTSRFDREPPRGARRTGEREEEGKEEGDSEANPQNRSSNREVGRWRGALPFLCHVSIVLLW